jgi:hypothetical protein
LAAGGLHGFEVLDNGAQMELVTRMDRDDRSPVRSTDGHRISSP